VRWQETLLSLRLLYVCKTLDVIWIVSRLRRDQNLFQKQNGFSDRLSC